MKKIGIVGWKTGPNSFGVTIPYMEFFSKFGDVEIVSATETDVRVHLDLMVMPGGPDVDPSKYTDRLSYYMGKQCPFRERFDNVLLDKYMELKIPIFGICRGHQSFAVRMGGKLIQDMHHDTNATNDRDKLVHKMNFSNLSNFDLNAYQLSGTNYYKVNSIHHQVVDSNNLPNNAKVIGFNPEDDTVEALGYSEYPAFTVQYHPEEIDCMFASQLIDNLLDEEYIMKYQTVEKMEYLNNN